MSTLAVASATDSTPTVASAGEPGDAWLLSRLKARLSSRLSYALGDQVVYSFGNMVIAALLSRHCGQREFGIYILTQRAMDVLIQLSNVLLWAPFTFNLPGRAVDHKAAYEGSMFVLQLALCGLFTAMLWGAAVSFAGTPSGLYFSTFQPLVLTSGGILFREFTRRMYFAHLRMKEAFWTESATVALQIAGVAWLSHCGRLNVANTLIVLSAGACGVSLWWVLRDGRTLAISRHVVVSDGRLNLHMGRWFLGGNMIFLASSQWNPWVLGGLLGGGAVGAYAVCESVVNIPRVALTSMQNVMGPMVARTHHQEGRSGLRALVRRLDRMLLAGTVAFALAIVVIGPSIARLIFKFSPVHARMVLALLALNLVVYAATLAQSYALSALGRADTTLYTNGLGFVAQAALCFGFVRLWGTAGAAAAMLVGSLIVLAVRRGYFRRSLAAEAAAV